MSVVTYEAIVENGILRLLESVTLPEKTKVYVVVPASGETIPKHIRTPRLKNREQNADFMMEDTHPTNAALLLNLQ